MERLQKIYEFYKSKGFQILAITDVATPADEERVRTFLQDNGVNFMVAIAPLDDKMYAYNQLIGNKCIEIIVLKYNRKFQRNPSCHIDSKVRRTMERLWVCFKSNPSNFIHSNQIKFFAK